MRVASNSLKNESADDADMDGFATEIAEDTTRLGAATRLRIADFEFRIAEYATWKVESKLRNAEVYHNTEIRIPKSFIVFPQRMPYSTLQ